jgi:hypothetical protein
MRSIANGFVQALIFGGCLIASTFSANSQQKALGVFDAQADVGQVKNPGSAIYDSAGQEYTISGAGTNMWLGADEFHFVWKQMTGNFILSTRAQFVGKGVEAHRKIGWIVRSILDSDSPHVTAVVHGDGRTSLQFRRGKGAITEEKIFAITSADTLQLERKGNVYTASMARAGDTFSARTDLGSGVG